MKLLPGHGEKLKIGAGRGDATVKAGKKKINNFTLQQLD